MCSASLRQPSFCAPCPHLLRATSRAWTTCESTGWCSPHCRTVDRGRVAVRGGAGVPAVAAPLLRTLNDGNAQSGGGSGLLRTHRVRATLSTMQIAVAVVLLVGAGLLLRSFVQLFTFDRGFDPADVVTAVVTNPLGVARHELLPQRSQVVAEHQRLQERLFDELTTRLGRLPDVAAVGLSRNLPFGRNLPSHVRSAPTGTPVPGDPNEMVQTALQVVSPGYLDAMRFRLRAGRTFTLWTGARARAFWWPTKRWPANSSAAGPRMLESLLYVCVKGRCRTAAPTKAPRSCLPPDGTRSRSSPRSRARRRRRTGTGS